MTLRLITPPETLPISLAEAKAYLRVTHAGEDAGITGMIAAATNALDGRVGFLGRCLMPQTWDLVLDAFPASEIMIPLGPVASITSVTYTDPAGVQQTVDPIDYEVDTAPSFGGWIVPAGAWPATMTTINAVTVSFVAGTGAPPAVKQAIFDMVARAFDTRGEGRMLAPGIVADLAPFRRPVAI